MSGWSYVTRARQQGFLPVKYSPNSCSSFMALSKILFACSYVCRRFISLTKTEKKNGIKLDSMCAFVLFLRDSAQTGGGRGQGKRERESFVLKIY